MSYVLMYCNMWVFKGVAQILLADKFFGTKKYLIDDVHFEVFECAFCKSIFAWLAAFWKSMVGNLGNF